MSETREAWPALPLDEWQATRDTLHMITQMMGKMRLALSPMMNEWWQVPLYLTARGLTTSPIPNGLSTFQMDLDFFDHWLHITTSDGAEERIPLGGSNVADFYLALTTSLHTLCIPAHIWTVPVEVPNPIPFEQDTLHATYDPDQAQRFWRVLSQVDVVFKRFRAGFRGKSSPVQFFWGSFDLQLSRYSGKPAPVREDLNRVMQLAMDEEEYALGFWPGGDWPGAGRVESPVFYAYTVPKPEGLENAQVSPNEASWSSKLGEFILPYDAVRQAQDPVQMILDFARSTYENGARMAGWDLAELAYPRQAARHEAQPRITLVPEVPEAMRSEGSNL